MKIQYKITLLITVLCLFFTGCGQTQERGANAFIETEKDYIVGIKISGFETCAKIHLFENGEVRILYTDSYSPLYGMEERYGKDSVTTQYDDIQWKSDEILMQCSVIYDAITILNSKKPIKEAKATLDGKDVKMYLYENDYVSFSVFLNEKGNSIRKIEGKKQNSPFEINF